MAKKMLIDATHAEETRVVVVDGTRVEEFDFETVNKRQLAGNIYLAKVTRVEPSLQAAFIEYGGNRHGFLAFAEIHPDYYQIPAADRAALIAEEAAMAAEQEAEETAREKRGGRRSGRDRGRAAADAAAPTTSTDIPGMEVRDLSDQEAGTEGADAPASGDASDARGPADDHAEVPETEIAQDDAIESVAEEDVAEEIQAPRKTSSRARRYKIQEVIKVRQIMLVQVVKEERGNKGAALTTYLSLAGRYCVLMPNTARGGGISRKITVAADRKKLKEIASELEVPKGAGLIIRTAGSQRTRTEIRRDYEYLMRLWEQIRELTFKSIAPAPIYEEGDLIKRTIRDLYSKDIDEVLVEGERGYRTAKDFMAMIMPSHARNVKHYKDPVPLYARFQVESYLSAMFNPTVQLKSGGYIVIGVTEALVAIDVNSGRATKEGNIEDTATKTNLEAADEIARQLRLRDLAGLIVIDFIDMDERRNNASVEKRLKERLKTDRARIQLGKISGFGLLEMSRQRLRPGMLESTTQPCRHCHGTGLIRSDDSLALTILRAIEEEGTRNRSREVLLRAPVAVANYLMNTKREHVLGIEARTGMAVRVEADPALVSPDFAIEKFKTATRQVTAIVSPVLSVDASLMAQIDARASDEDDDEADADTREEAVTEDRAETSDRAEGHDDEGGDGEAGPRRRRRRRRRRPGDAVEGAPQRDGDEAEDEGDGRDPEADAALEGGDADERDAADDQPRDSSGEESARKRSRGRSRRRGGARDRDFGRGDERAAAVGADASDAQREDAPGAEPEPHAGSAPSGHDEAFDEAAGAPAPDRAETADDDAAMADHADAPGPADQADGPDAADDADVHVPDDVDPPQFDGTDGPSPAEDGPALQPANEVAPARPKRRGWWSLG